MKVQSAAWFKKWWFGFALAGMLLTFEIASLFIFIALTPKGSQWLGDLGFNASDYSVYLNYLWQTKDHLLIFNLFNNLPQTPRFDIFWSTAGLLVRVGLAPIASHELLRWAMTIILALAVYATAKTLTSTEKRARLASIFMVSGLSLGWIYAAWRDLGGPDIPSLGPTPPDLVTEFGISPVLLGGAHMILSLALLLLLMRWIYELICEQNNKKLIWLIVASLIFSFLHPYFIPLLGLQMLFCLALSIKKQKPKQSLFYFCIFGLSLIPAASYYVWLAALDPAFKTHHLIVNQLKLSSPWTWLIALVPLIWAAFRILTKKVSRDYYWPQTPTWVWFWIVSALICIALPFPWQRKYTQGLLMALVILTLPYWLSLAESILAKWRTNLKYFFGLLIFIAFLAAPYLYLFQIQLTASRTDFNYHFYQSNELFSAWALLSKGNFLIITDDPWVNLWTPAKTGQHVWMGHAHETPDYFGRLDQYTDWMNTDKPTEFNRFLDENHVTALIATKPENQARFERLINQNFWQKTFQQSQVTVWIKR
jgi:hypothetical protein